MSLNTQIFLLLKVLLMLGLCEEASAGKPEDKSIHWILLDFPPFVEIELKDDAKIDFGKVNGPLADIQRDLVNTLDEYNHSFQVVSFPRAEKLFKSQKHYCTILFLRTPEREKYMVFGDRLASTAPPGIVLNEAKSKPLSAGREAPIALDLAELMKNSFRLGVVKGRAFSPEIDKIINQSKTPRLELVANQAIGSLFKMLIANRLDGVISYYMEFANEQEINPGAATLRFHTLNHNQKTLHLPISCERSSWGKTMVGIISRAAKKPATQKKIALLLKQTVPPMARAPAHLKPKPEPWPDKLQ